MFFVVFLVFLCHVIQGVKGKKISKLLFFWATLVSVKAQCPVANCPPITDTGVAEPAGVGFTAGEMCVTTSIVGNRLTTTISCNGFDPNGLIQVFVMRVEGDLTPIFPTSSTPGDGPLVATFACNDDGTWNVTGPSPSGPISGTDVFCDVYCNPGVTCSATRPATCPVSGTPAPPCAMTTTTTTSTTTTTTTPSPTTTPSLTTRATTLAATATTACNCFVGGTWSAWSAATACNSSCGSCGVTTQTRTCLSAASGCPCSGSTTQNTPCGTAVCNFPATPCCTPYTSMLGGTGFYCGPLPTPTSEPPASTVCASPGCAVGGTWSAWSGAGSSSCNSSCGMCGLQTQTRTCLSLITNGCPCTGSNTQQINCPSNVCYFPNSTCCDGFTKISSASGFTCA